MMTEEILKGRARMLKTKRGKSTVDTRLGKEMREAKRS